MRSTNATAQGYVFCSELALLLCRITGAYDGDVAPEYCTPGRLFDLLTGEMGGRKCANEHVFPLCGHAPRRNYAVR